MLQAVIVEEVVTRHLLHQEDKTRGFFLSSHTIFKAMCWERRKMERMNRKRESCPAVTQEMKSWEHANRTSCWNHAAVKAFLADSCCYSSSPPMFYERRTKDTNPMGSRTNHFLAREEVRYLEGPRKVHESLDIFFTWQDTNHTSINMSEYTARKGPVMPNIYKNAHQAVFLNFKQYNSPGTIW